MKIKRNDMKKIYEYKKAFIIISVIVLIFFVWLVFVIKINLESEKDEYKYYEINEPIEYKEMSFVILDYEKLSEEEMNNKYTITKNDMGFPDDNIDFTYYIVWMDVKSLNVESESQLGSVVNGASLLRKADASQFSFDFVLDQNGEKRDDYFYEDLKAGKTVRAGIIATFNINELWLSQKYVKIVDEYPLYMELEDYEGSRFIRRIKLN